VLFFFPGLHAVVSDFYFFFQVSVMQVARPRVFLGAFYFGRW